MMTVPSVRLVRWGTLLALLSFGVLVLPEAGLAVLACDCVLVAAALLDWLLTPGPDRVEMQRVLPERVSVLQEHAVTLIVRNRSGAALQVRLRDGVPEAFRPDVEELSGVVAAHGETRLAYEARPLVRGHFTWGPISLRYRSVLGLWERQKVLAAPGAVRVYPNLAALSRYFLLARAHKLESLGIHQVRQRGSAWEFESLRDYVRGDDTRLIDWKATARRRKLITRNQEAERNQTVLLLLDSGRLMNAEEDGVAKLDHAVNTTLLLAHVALSRGDRVGLCTFSSRVHAWVPPRPHLGQLRLITDALYDLRGDFSETDHGRCLRLLSARHRKRALLIVLTDFVDAETARDMIGHLQRAARRHLVLFAALKDMFLDRAARSRPHTPLEGYRKAAALELLRERRAVLEQLRQRGAHVLDVEPAGLTPPVINRYLEITRRGEL